MNRLGTRMSTGSGGWRTKSRSSTVVDSDEEDTRSTGSKSNGKLLEPGENERVVVTPPGDAQRERSHAVDMRAWVGAPSPPPARSHVEKGKERAKEESLHADANKHEPQTKAGKHERSRSRASSRASGAAAGHTLRHERDEDAPEPLEAQGAGDARRSVDNVSVRTEDEELAMPGGFYGSLGSRESRRRSGSQRSHRSHHSHHLHHPDGLLAGIMRRMKLS